MSDEQTHFPSVERREIMEERGNRDAFYALLIVSLLFALFLVALIIAAWNTRIAFLPLMPKSPAPAAEKTQFTFAPPIESPVRRVSGNALLMVYAYDNGAVRAGVRAPRSPAPAIHLQAGQISAEVHDAFLGASDTARPCAGPSCRPAEKLCGANLRSTRESHVSPACDRSRSDTTAAPFSLPTRSWSAALELQPASTMAVSVDRHPRENV